MQKATIDKWVPSDTKCPMDGKYMVIEEDNEVEKIFYCNNCEGYWKYDKATKHMFRVRG